MEQDGLSSDALRGSLGDLFAAQLGMDPRILSFAMARRSDQNAQAQTAVLDAQVPGSLSPLAGDDGARALPGEAPIADALQTLVDVIPEDLSQKEPAQAEAPPPAAMHAGYQ